MFNYEIKKCAMKHIKRKIHAPFQIRIENSLVPIINDSGAITLLLTVESVWTLDWPGSGTLAADMLFVYNSTKLPQQLLQQLD